MYKDPIWPDVLVIVDVIGGVLLVAYMLFLGVVL